MPVFAIKDRVMVPGQEAEGVVTDVTESVPDFPVYTVKWMTPEGEPRIGTCGEGDLRGANPTDADIAAEDAAAQERSEALNAMVAVQVEDRLAELAAARRKRSRRKPREVIFKAKRKR